MAAKLHTMLGLVFRVPNYNFLFPSLNWPHPDPSLTRSRLATFGVSNNSVTGIYFQMTCQQLLL